MLRKRLWKECTRHLFRYAMILRKLKLIEADSRITSALERDEIADRWCITDEDPDATQCDRDKLQNRP